MTIKTPYTYNMLPKMLKILIVNATTKSMAAFSQLITHYMSLPLDLQVWQYRCETNVWRFYI